MSAGGSCIGSTARCQRRPDDRREHDAVWLPVGVGDHVHVVGRLSRRLVSVHGEDARLVGPVGVPERDAMPVQPRGVADSAGVEAPAAQDGCALRKAIMSRMTQESRVLLAKPPADPAGGAVLAVGVFVAVPGRGRSRPPRGSWVCRRYEDEPEEDMKEELTIRPAGIVARPRPPRLRDRGDHIAKFLPGASSSHLRCSRRASMSNVISYRWAHSKTMLQDRSLATWLTLGIHHHPSRPRSGARRRRSQGFQSTL